MSFFDEPLSHLPKDAEFYYNILVIDLAIQPDQSQEFFERQDVVDIWYLEKITSARPYALHIYVDEELEEDFEYELMTFPHCVIEIDKDNNVFCHDILDVDTDDPWRIE